MKQPDIRLSPFEKTWLNWILNPAEEPILWVGKPRHLHHHDGSVAVLCGAIFWLPVAAIIFFREVEHTGWDSPWEQVCTYALCIMYTAACILYPVWKRFKAQHTVYVLTQRRAIIQAPRLSGRPRYHIYPLHAAMIRDCYVDNRGIGSLIFDHGYMFVGFHHLIGWPIGFLNTPDFAKVHHLLLHELAHRHGLTPAALPHHTHRSDNTRPVQLIVACLLVLAGISLAEEAHAHPPEWEQKEVTINYRQALSTGEEDGAFLLQAADGSCFRVPLIGSCGQHQDGERIRIIHPAHNPLLARLAPADKCHAAVSWGLILCGVILMAFSVNLYLHLRSKQRGTT